MVGSLSAGLLLADEAGAHLPSVDDFLPPEILFQGTLFAINQHIAEAIRKGRRSAL